MVSNALHNRHIRHTRKICRPPPPPDPCNHVCCRKAIPFNFLSTVYDLAGSVYNQLVGPSVADFRYPTAPGCLFAQGVPWGVPPTTQIGFSVDETTSRCEILLVHAIPSPGESSSGGPATWGTPDGPRMLFQALAIVTPFPANRLNHVYHVPDDAWLYLDAHQSVSNFYFSV